MMGRKNAASLGAVLLTMMLAGGVAEAASGSFIADCPMVDAPYSVDSPLLDILANPEALAVLSGDYGVFLNKAGPGFLSTKTPSFASIVTPRFLVDWARVSPSRLPELDAELRRIPVSRHDRVSRCERYDEDLPAMALPPRVPAVLVFEKVNGFRDAASIAAAHAALVILGQRNGWAMLFTDKAGVMRAEVLRKFRAVVWNNVSGDVLTLTGCGKRLGRAGHWPRFRRFLAQGVSHSGR